MLHQLDWSDAEPPGRRTGFTVRPDVLDHYLESRSAWSRVRPRRDGTVDAGGGRSVLLTFDDGYRGAAERGLPVLERHEATAIFFVTTGFVTGDAYPMELELADVLEERDALALPGGQAMEFGDGADREAGYERIRRQLKARRPAGREAYMEELAELNGYERDRVRTERFVSWETVRRLDGHDLVTVGAHTRLHPVLTELPRREALAELRACREQLEKVLDRPVRHLSYPYGAHDFAVRRLARLAGFRCAFTTEARRCRGIGWTNRLRVPRLDISRLVAG